MRAPLENELALILNLVIAEYFTPQIHQTKPTLNFWYHPLLLADSDCLFMLDDSSQIILK